MELQYKSKGIIYRTIVTVQQVCAFTALTVRKRSGSRHKSITKVILHGFVLVTMRVLNSYEQ